MKVCVWFVFRINFFQEACVKLPKMNSRTGRALAQELVKYVKEKREEFFSSSSFSFEVSFPPFSEEEAASGVGFIFKTIAPLTAAGAAGTERSLPGPCPTCPWSHLPECVPASPVPVPRPLARLPENPCPTDPLPHQSSGPPDARPRRRPRPCRPESQQLRAGRARSRPSASPGRAGQRLGVQRRGPRTPPSAPRPRCPRCPRCLRCPAPPPLRRSASVPPPPWQGGGGAGPCLLVPIPRPAPSLLPAASTAVCFLRCVAFFPSKAPSKVALLLKYEAISSPIPLVTQGGNQWTYILSQEL